MPIDIEPPVEPPIQELIAQAIKVNRRIGIVWGGQDINPLIYNRPVSKSCGQWSQIRDEVETQFIKDCISTYTPIIGICRGAQLLNCINGGILIQHVSQHNYDHDITTIDGETLQVTSTHHQAMIPTTDAIVFARAYHKSKGVHWDNVDEPYTYPHVNEIVYYKDTKSLCIQPHPEYEGMDHPMNIYLDFLTKKLFNVKIDWIQTQNTHSMQGKSYGLCIIRK